MGNTGRMLLCIILFLLISPWSASSQSSKKVLILNSYHHGFKWTDEESDSVIAQLDESGIPTKYFIEYMGTKWVYNQEYLERLPDIYRLKFKNISFDLIVATDDDAFTFLLKNRNDLFGKVPVIFCGVNWFEAKRLEGHTGYTGVNEDADIALNVDLMLRLHPEVKKIFMVVDRTTTGLIVQRKIRDTIAAYEDRVAIHILDDISLSQLDDKVSQLSDDSLVFLTIFQKDNKGEFVEFSEIAQRLSRHSRVPVYGLWDFYLGYGIVGGMLTSGASQGQRAGELGARILAGESPDKLPVIMNSPNRYRFDYTEMKNAGIKAVDLPAGSTMINAPSSFYTVAKKFVWAVLIGGFLAIMIIFSLVVAMRRRNRAERALRESDVRYQTLVDNLSLGVYRFSGDRRGEILQANPAMAKIYGYDTLEELQRSTVNDHYQDPGERSRFLQEIGAQGYLKDCELQMQKKDGTPIWVLCNATAVFDETGSLKWVDGIHEDITERKRLEEQLRQAQKMEAIGTLAGGVAHDFNNILTAIIGFGNLLKVEVGDNEDAQNYLDPILVSADKAAQLTQSLLAFGRKQIINLQSVDVNEIVENFSKLLLRVIGEDIELAVESHCDHLMTLADRGQVEQVLMNLVTNARDAMPDGGTIIIETDRIHLTSEFLVRHEFMRPGNYAVLSVSDTGSGIDEETRARIFEPYFSTKTVGKGTGLGLSIVYGIVKQHNGDISVYSEQGKGTTFKIYFPLIDKNVATEKEILRQSEIEGGNETILIGEDNNEVRGSTEHLLAMAGYTVITAVDGDDVLKKFKDNKDRVDLLLLDVVLPKKNGKEVFDAVCLLRPDVKVLFMSGYTANIILKKGVLNKGLNFIAKPLSPDLLLAKVREVLSHPHVS